MRSILRATVFALLLPLVSGVARAQQAPVKIAYVNTAALMDAAPGRLAADSLLKREGDALTATLQKLQDSVNAMLTKYQKDEPTLSATAKDTRQKAIQSLETDLQAKNLKAQQQMQQRQSEVTAPMIDAVKKVLDDIRIEDGYTVIFANDPGSSTIVSADKNLDITDRVVSRLRATKAPVAAPAAAKPGAPVAPAGVVKPKPPTQ
jgi:outer membrane protein